MLQPRPFSHPVSSTLAAAFVFAAVVGSVFGCSSGDGDGSNDTHGSSGSSGSSQSPSSSSGSSGSSGSTSSSSSSSGSSSATPSKAVDGPLQLTSLQAATPTLTFNAKPPVETETTKIIAIVTHSAGNERIAGGQLEDDAGHVYEAFGSGANKSTFVLDIDWDQINAVSPVRANKGEGRNFVAKFFDNDGHQVSKTLELAFQCRVFAADIGNPRLPEGGVLTGTYDGKCFDDARCGKSGAVCQAGESCNVKTETCAKIAYQLVGCIDREAFPGLPSYTCSWGVSSNSSPGKCEWCKP